MAFPGPNATRKEIAAFFKSRGLDQHGQTVWIEFADWNCNNYKTADEEPCRGWDGKSGRCDCGSRRVYWSEDEETGDKIAMADTEGQDMRPTKAQVAKARETITASVTTSLDDGQHEELREACKVMLDHTAPMGWTDHDDTWVELRAEARAWLEEHDMEKDVDIYMAGACREGQV